MGDIWDASDRRLYAASVAAIKQFVNEHPAQELCAFFFDCDDPQYGKVHISLDTRSNNIRSVKELERFAIESRRRNLQSKRWQYAKYNLSTPVLSLFNTNSGGFAYQLYATVEFPEWIEMAKKGDYPKAGEHDDDYLESNARLVMWRVSEQLVDEDAFGPLRLASPFVIGYGVHDQETAILRLLNWPEIV